MKTDKTPPASTSEITASARPFSNRHHPKPTATKPLLPLNQTKKKVQEKETLLKSFKEDVTAASESTAKGDSVTTPKQTFNSPAPITTPNIKTKTPILNNESFISPTTKVDGFSTPIKRKNDKKQAYFSKVNENIDKIQVDQSKQISWIRKLGKQKWISIFETFLIGFSLIFFTTAFYFIFHINPLLEMKLTPEFQSKVEIFLSKNNFKNCHHSSWLTSDILNLPIIDDSRCFGFFEYGRVFFEIFKSSTPTTSSDECSVDRIEIYPCYSKNASVDPLNIFWGVNITEFNFICNGSTAVAMASHSLFSFNPPVQKYTLIGKEMQEVLINRIVSSTAFFFQCPECALGNRVHPSSNFFKLKKDNQKKLRYTIGVIHESIPFNARTCVGSLSTNCDLDKSRLVKNTGNSFSHRVIKHKIVEDKGFCSV